MKYLSIGTRILAAAAAGLLFTGCEKDPVEQYKAVPYAYVSAGNMPTAGTVSVEYSDSPKGSEIEKLLDNDYSTCFTTSHDNFNVIWNGDGSVAATSYYIVSASGSPESDIASWVISGSADNKSWKTLDSQSGVSFSERGEKKTFEIASSAIYKYYRLKVRANNGGSETSIAEWGLVTDSKVVEFVDIRTRLSDLAQYFGGWTESPDTPMGQHIGSRSREASSDDIKWLANASENPAVEASGDLSVSKGYDWRSCNVTLYPFGNPVPADVNQHAIGDCSLCAVLASFAYMHPDFIKDIIKSSGSSFSVAMYDPKGQPITVGVSNEFICDGNGNIAQLSGKNNTATWSSVLEKALMKWEQVYRASYPIAGIGTEHAAPPFTGEGNSFSVSPGSVTPEQLSKIAKTAVELGYVGIGGFTRSDVVAEDPFKTVSGHAFTIMYPQKNNALFAMRNPWGGASGSPDGKEDGVMNIYDDQVVPPMIDFRIVYPGKLTEYPSVAGPYTPPSFSRGSFWISAGMRSRLGLGPVGNEY
ncbi:MAG: C2 family cysteine protease [Bacteroidales bacterium]|nr:C2 family cysteine protease [Bacteroides sp.]MCM1198368.1 C2 family cysteine protease [Clostridium sp.]MCM1501567.1 C2 family cysteine protease [Bacteroidales bacterium]